jgi:hypothetical protein
VARLHGLRSKRIARWSEAIFQPIPVVPARSELANMLTDSGSSVIPLVKLSSTHAPSSSEVGVRSGHRSASAANEERQATLSCLAGVALRPPDGIFDAAG